MHMEIGINKALIGHMQVFAEEIRNKRLLSLVDGVEAGTADFSRGRNFANAGPGVRKIMEKGVQLSMRTKRQISV